MLADRAALNSLRTLYTDLQETVPVLLEIRESVKTLSTQIVQVIELHVIRINDFLSLRILLIFSDILARIRHLVPCT